MRERALSLHRTHTHTNTQAMPSEEGPGPGSYEISAHDARTWHKAPAPKFGREMQRGGVIGAGAGGGLAFESFLERELMDMPAPDAYDVSLSWTAPSVIKDFGSEVRLPEYQAAYYIILIIMIIAPSGSGRLLCGREHVLCVHVCACACVCQLNSECQCTRSMLEYSAVSGAAGLVK